MSNTTPSGADALLQLIESYVEKRHTHGAPQYNVVTARARDAVLAALSAAQEAPVQAAQAVPQGLEDRIEAAIQRIVDNHAPRRIPADPTDVDLVLAEVLALIRGKWPPFWIHEAAPAAPHPAAPVHPGDDAMFELWWADHMPNASQADAWAEWCSLRANQPEPQPAAQQGDALSYVHPVPDHCDRVVWRNRYLHLAAQAQESAQRDSLHDCAVGDSNYAAGMLLGWNLCTDGRDEDFRRIREDRLRAAASASKEAQEEAPAAPQPLDLSVMELAESVRLIGPESRTGDLHKAIQRFHDLIVTNASIKASRHFADGLAQPAQQERKRRYAQGTALGESGIIPMCDQVDDEPVKVPSDDLAHEIWAAAQTAPGEGIEDAVERVAALLASTPAPAQHPLPDEKDALLRQALEALEALEAYSKSGYVRHEHPKKYAAGGAVAEAIRKHLGVKND